MGYYKKDGSTYGWADRLVRRIVPDSEVRVLQRLFACDAFRRIKVEHLGE
jgi:hypothetical protein